MEFDCECVVVEELLTGSAFAPENLESTLFKMQQQAALNARIEETRALTQDDFVKCKEFWKGLVLIFCRFKPSVQC